MLRITDLIALGFSLVILTLQWLANATQSSSNLSLPLLVGLENIVGTVFLFAGRPRL